MSYQVSIEYLKNNTLQKLTKDFSDKLDENDFSLELTTKFIRNSKNQVIELEINPKTEIYLRTFTLTETIDYTDKLAVLVNGFQSWTETREYYLTEKIPKLSGLFWDMMSRSGDYTIFKNANKKGYLHSFNHTYITYKGNSDVVFYGSLNEKNVYTIFQHTVPNGKLLIHADCMGLKLVNKPFTLLNYIKGESTTESFWSVYNAELQLTTPKAKPATGWTSWYNYYTKIDEKIIEENLNAFAEKKIPIDFFQIDDGWQTQTGDWLTVNQKFGGTMKPIADKIKSKRYMAGLWIAPFIASEGSETYKKHPDWFIKLDEEKKVTAGFNPLWGGTKNGWFFCLDIYNDDVIKYLENIFSKTFTDWGFDMVKLDFLYAAAIVPRNNKTRAQVMYDAMKLLRRLCGDKFILGCGVPLAQSYGLVEYCRIGADVGLNWDTKWMRNLNQRERVSTINTLLATINRRGMNGRGFLNDPDVFILRDENNKLIVNQQRTLLIVNHIFGGLVFTSDNINTYPAPTLDLYKTTFPFTLSQVYFVARQNLVFEVRFAKNNKLYKAYINLGKKEAVYDTGTTTKLYNALTETIEEIKTVSLQGFESKIFLEPGFAPFSLYYGGGHLFPGSEIDSITGDDNSIYITYNNKALVKKPIVIRLPQLENMPTSYTINGKPYVVERMDDINVIKYNPNNV